MVSWFEMNPTTLELNYTTRKDIWREKPALIGIHSGEGLVYGNDDKLYITTGDGRRREMPTSSPTFMAR
jgi:glucose/arabinose dehydrogenase